MPRYSIVLVARDHPRQLLTALMALRVRAHPDDIVLVDNGSVAQLDHIVTLSKAPVRIIRLAEHQSLGTAMNAGIEAAAYDTVLLLHADTQIVSDPLRSVVYLHEHPSVGVIGGKLYHSGPSPRRLLEIGYEVGRGRINPLPISGMERDVYNAPLVITATSTACMLIRRAEPRFDERYWFRFEDVDLCHQYAQRGWSIVMLPELRAIHLQDAGLRERSTEPAWAARQLASHLLYHQRWCSDVPLHQHPVQEAVRGEPASACLHSMHESIIGRPASPHAGAIDWK